MAYFMLLTIQSFGKIRLSVTQKSIRRTEHENS